MSDDRVKQRIQALRRKTVAAGCTEAEAVAAAEKAAALMREHGLSEAELVMTDACAPEVSMRPTWRWDLAGRIAEVTNCDYIRTGPGFLFVGLAPGPEIAVYLQEVCVRAVEAELAAFKDGAFYRRRRATKTRRAAAADFTAAMVHRLCSRLSNLFSGLVDQKAATLAEKALAARFPEARALNRAKRETRFDEAAAAGHIAGGRVGLRHGMAAEARRQIGTNAGGEA